MPARWLWLWLSPAGIRISSAELSAALSPIRISSSRLPASQHGRISPIRLSQSLDSLSRAWAWRCFGDDFRRRCRCLRDSSHGIRRRVLRWRRLWPWKVQAWQVWEASWWQVQEVQMMGVSLFLPVCLPLSF